MRSSAVIILSLCFLGTIVGIYGRDEDAMACAKELNIDTSSAEKDPKNELSHFTKDEQHCLMACILKRRDLGSKSIHEVLTKQVKVNGITLPDQLTQKMEKCKDKDDCEYLKCIDLMSEFAGYFVV